MAFKAAILVPPCRKVCKDQGRDCLIGGHGDRRGSQPWSHVLNCWRACNKHYHSSLPQTNWIKISGAGAWASGFLKLSRCLWAQPGLRINVETKAMAAKRREEIRWKHNGWGNLSNCGETVWRQTKEPVGIEGDWRRVCRLQVSYVRAICCCKHLDLYNCLKWKDSFLLGLNIITMVIIGIMWMLKFTYFKKLGALQTSSILAFSSIYMVMLCLIHIGGKFKTQSESIIHDCTLIGWKEIFIH